jgi:hypothetical protein
MAEKKRKVGEGRGVIAENPMPDDRENITLSKADFIKKMEDKKLKEAKLKEFSKELDKVSKPEKVEKVEEKKEETTEAKPKKMGRPKKIV